MRKFSWNWIGQVDIILRMCMLGIIDVFLDIPFWAYLYVLLISDPILSRTD